MQEFRETQVWTERVVEAVQEFFAEWLPRPLAARDVIERVRVPQRDYFSFGEKLAVVEQGTSDPTGMGFVYERVAGFLASDLREIGALLGEDQARRVAGEAAADRPAPVEREDDRIDVFVSHDGSQTEWTLEFVELLRRSLHKHLGRAPRIFYEIAEIKVGGDTWVDQLQSMLQRARVMVPILTPRYVRSKFSMRELHYFISKPRGTASAPVFPIMLADAVLPREIADRHALDLRKYPIRAAAGTEAPWLTEVDQLAQAIADHLKQRLPWPASGQTFRDKLKIGGEGPLMVVIPAGQFMMGSPANEPERSDAEGPQHEVHIAKPFAMGVYAVTFDEYDRFCESTERKKPGDNAWGRGNRPVIKVSWNDTQAYCAWLSHQTGRSYRLPSEAEWEYACRAGTTAPFHFGARITTEQANFNGNDTYNGSSKGEYREKSTPVGSFPPNTFGLHDMHGNVWEWCHDAWHGSYDGAPTDGSAWESGDGVSRVRRGGSWDSKPRLCRAADRRNDDPANRNSYIGFRVCCSSPSNS
jgi:formylglycine-generating enzyme required for sulfatase activity